MEHESAENETANDDEDFDDPDIYDDQINEVDFLELFGHSSDEEDFEGFENMDCTWVE